jgi:predicted O-methyltransferase YrrM
MDSQRLDISKPIIKCFEMNRLIKPALFEPQQTQLEGVTIEMPPCTPAERSKLIMHASAWLQSSSSSSSSNLLDFKPDPQKALFPPSHAFYHAQDLACADVNSPLEVSYMRNLLTKYSKEFAPLLRRQSMRAHIITNSVLTDKYKDLRCPNNGSIMLNDVEALLTYSILREVNASRVIEFSPHTGWSSSWIIEALKKNGNNGAMLYSYDLYPCATPYLDSFGLSEFNHVTVGDATEHFKSMAHMNPDFLFIDSDHSKPFAETYVRDLLTPLLNTGIPVMVHDMYHSHNPDPFEGEAVFAFLRKHNIEYFTASSKACRGNNLFREFEVNPATGKEWYINHWHQYVSSSAIFFYL